MTKYKVVVSTPEVKDKHYYDSRDQAFDKWLSLAALVLRCGAGRCYAVLYEWDGDDDAYIVRMYAT